MSVQSDIATRNAEMRKAWKVWWRLISLKGDPQRRPDLAAEAFEAGYIAGSSLTVGE